MPQLSPSLGILIFTGVLSFYLLVNFGLVNSSQPLLSTFVSSKTTKSELPLFR
uniref:ATP synthase subunit 8 n=1 Tax=Leucophytia bidentata TaxID=999262 RepID=G8HMU6_9EUPU|nr:ATP synthase F0 subunit 8 [Leucophytia bidentata]AEQ93820.1 ATP synthase subunit 8 [Leucophytia bidentata]